MSVTQYAIIYHQTCRVRSYSNTISAMKTLAEQSEILDDEKYKVHPDAEQAKDFMKTIKTDHEIDERVAGYINALWNDEGIQATYQDRWGRYIIANALVNESNVFLCCMLTLDNAGHCFNSRIPLHISSSELTILPKTTIFPVNRTCCAVACVPRES